MDNKKGVINRIRRNRDYHKDNPITSGGFSFKSMNDRLSWISTDLDDLLEIVNDLGYDPDAMTANDAGYCAGYHTGHRAARLGASRDLEAARKELEATKKELKLADKGVFRLDKELGLADDEISSQDRTITSLRNSIQTAFEGKITCSHTDAPIPECDHEWDIDQGKFEPCEFTLRVAGCEKCGKVEWQRPF